MATITKRRSAPRNSSAAPAVLPATHTARATDGTVVSTAEMFAWIDETVAIVDGQPLAEDTSRLGRLAVSNYRHQLRSVRDGTYGPWQQLLVDRAARHAAGESARSILSGVPDGTAAPAAGPATTAAPASGLSPSVRRDLAILGAAAHGDVDIVLSVVSYVKSFGCATFDDMIRMCDRKAKAAVAAARRSPQTLTGAPMSNPASPAPSAATDPAAAAKAEWAAMSADQRAAWIDENTYVTFRKAELAGRVNVVDRPRDAR